MDHSPLERLLLHNAETGRVPFHMPGHKRRALHSPSLPWALDVTEIDGFDDLHDPEGILAESMDRAAALWGSDEARYLVNGSTGGLLAALHTLLPPGSTVLVARNCHKAVYHGLELLHARPVYLLPPVIPAFGVAASIPPETVAQALAEHPEARALVLTSPSYDGVLSDLPAICALCHEKNVPVLVDEAHGAHLGFGPFPSGAVAAGADIVVQSLHKTLPSLTQTALLHRQGPRVDPDALHRSLGVFQTSSPSYPLMASMDGCVDLLAREGADLARTWFGAIEAFHRTVGPLRHLRVLGHDGLPEGCFGFDPSKLVISTLGTDLTGPQLARRLREDFSMEPEMVAPHYVTAMTGMGDRPEDLLALADALLTIDSGLTAAEASPLPTSVLPPIRRTAAQAVNSPWEEVDLTAAVDRISAEYLWAYPPGIPLLAPGEVLTEETLALCLAYEAQGVPLKHTGGSAEHRLKVCQTP